MAWSDAARRAAAETRRRRKAQSIAYTKRENIWARSTYKKRTAPTLDELQSKYNRQLDPSNKRTTGRSLQRTREAMIKKRFDMGY